MTKSPNNVNKSTKIVSRLAYRELHLLVSFFDIMLLEMRRQNNIVRAILPAY